MAQLCHVGARFEAHDDSILTAPLVSKLSYPRTIVSTIWPKTNQSQPSQGNTMVTALFLAVRRTGPPPDGHDHPETT